MPVVGAHEVAGIAGSIEADPGAAATDGVTDLEAALARVAASGA